MNKIQDNHWIQDIKHPARRQELIFCLLSLMDKQHQENKWIYPAKFGSQESFDAEINFTMDMIIEELFMDVCIEENKLPLDKISIILKDKNEAQKLFDVAEMLCAMSEYQTNKEYLTSSELPKLRRASLEAFEVFMENEKDNEKFCKFIVDIIKKERNWFKIKQKTKRPYLIILDYIKDCRNAL